MDIQSFSVVNLVSDADCARLVEILDEGGFDVFELDGSGVADAGSFFSAVVAALPTPAGAHANGFDALRDHVRVGLATLESTDVAFVWRHADEMLEQGLMTLLDAVDMFTSLARQVYSPAATNFPRRIRLLTFLTGAGPNFPPLVDDAT